MEFLFKAHQKQGGVNRACTVKLDDTEGSLRLHLATTGGSPFSSVYLSEEAAQELSAALLELAPLPRKRGRALPFVFVGLVAMVLGAVLGITLGPLYFWKPYMPKPRPSPTVNLRSLQTPAPKADPSPAATRTRISEVTRTVLSYLSKPGFAGEEFERQLLGDWELQTWYSDTNDVLFSSTSGSVVPPHFVRDPNGVEFAARTIEGYEFADLSLRGPSLGTLVRTHASNLNLEPWQSLRLPFQRATYEISLSELDDFLANRSVYYKGLQSYEATENSLIANHGAFVAEPGEPSLTRFCGKLALYSRTREEKIQALLGLVTNEISYNEEETLTAYETLKRPNEVLLTRTSDCSGKAILFASLLEQIGEHYYLVYTSNHIAVYVEQGSFPSLNEYSIAVKGCRYVLAECTVPGFVIGRTELVNPLSPSEILFLQRPSESVLRNRFGEPIGPS